MPSSRTNSFPLDNSQLVHHQRKPDVPWLVSAEPHLAAVSSQQVAGDPSQPTWGSNPGSRIPPRACQPKFKVAWSLRIFRKVLNYLV